MRRRTSRQRVGIALSLVVALVLSACGGGGSSSKASASSGSSSSSPKKDKSEQSAVSDIAAFSDNDPTVGKTKFGPDDDDKIIEASINDIESFWSEEFPKVYGKPYEKIAGGHFRYGPPPDTPPLDCPSTTPGRYDQVGPNAFYCFAPGDYIEWDSDAVTNEMLQDFGPFSLAIVMAHEIGHAVSQRAGVIDLHLGTFVQEQQADCFAGAYTAWVAQGRSNLFELHLKDLDSALGAFLQIRDPVGNDAPNDPNGHGSAFQRINAFEDGLNGGAQQCKGYAEGNFTYVPETYVDESDYAAQGNLPPDQIEPDVEASLEQFWSAAVGSAWTKLTVKPFDPDTDTVTCGSSSASGQDAVGLSLYCAADDTALWDEHYLMPAANQVGDMAQGALIADIYSTRAQHIEQLPTDTVDANLQASCFTGVWVGSLATKELSADLTLSPGDLDEIVAGFLKYSADADTVEQGSSSSGSAFERLDAFRAGFQATFNGTIVDGFKLCLNNGGSTAANSDSTASNIQSDFSDLGGLGS